MNIRAKANSAKLVVIAGAITALATEDVSEDSWESEAEETFAVDLAQDNPAVLTLEVSLTEQHAAAAGGDLLITITADRAASDLTATLVHEAPVVTASVDPNSEFGPVSRSPELPNVDRVSIHRGLSCAELEPDDEARRDCVDQFAFTLQKDSAAPMVVEVHLVVRAWGWGKDPEGEIRIGVAGP